VIYTKVAHVTRTYSL